MSRDPLLYLSDIVEACRRVEAYSAGIAKDDFIADTMRFDAVTRNLEVIGEAAKKTPPEIRLLVPLVEWSKIAGMRDWLAHAYFAVNTDIVWDVVQNHVPALHRSIQQFLSSGAANNSDS